MRSGRLPEGFEERIRLLGTRQRDLVIDDKERNFLDSKPTRQFIGFLDRLPAIVEAARAPFSE